MNTRREFLKHVGAGAGLALASRTGLAAPIATGGSDKLGPILPTRPLGRTGEQVTMFCLGGAHVARVQPDADAQAILEKSLELGVRTFDTAWAYGGGRSEELFGRYLVPKYRDHVFIYTKSKAVDAAGMREHLEDSLRRMRTDHLDLWMMHEVRSPEDVDARLEAGVLEVMLGARERGLVRHLGFSGHTRTDAHRRLMERVADADPFVAVQVPVNPLDAAKPDSFVKELVPDLVARGYAVFAMKTIAHGRFFAANTDRIAIADPIIPNHLSMREALTFALSQPIATLVSGMDRLEQVSENVGIVRAFEPMSTAAQAEVVARMERFKFTPRIEGYRPAPRAPA